MSKAIVALAWPLAATRPGQGGAGHSLARPFTAGVRTVPLFGNGNKGRMDIAYIFRRRPGTYSIERVFAPILAQLRSQGIEGAMLQVPRESSSFWNVLANVVWARRVKAELVHVTGDVNYCILGLGRRMSVLTIHDFGYLAQLHGLKRWLVKKLWVDWPVSRCTAVTCVSEQTRRDLLRLTPVAPDKVVVIHNPVQPQFVPQSEAAWPACPRILHFNVTPNKNLGRTVAALEGIPCHLRIIGAVNDAQKRELERRRISFSQAENLTDAQMLQEYEQCDLVCFPSTDEGFGLPVIEAQAVGRPVLTSHVPPLPEVGGAGGACYVDPFDVASIRAGLCKMMTDGDYRAGLVAAGFANARRFQATAIARQYADLYARLLSPGRAGNGRPASSRLP